MGTVAQLALLGICIVWRPIFLLFWENVLKEGFFFCLGWGWG